MPFYLSIGLAKNEVDVSCPTDLKPYEEASNLALMRQDTLNWYNGLYTLSALQVALSQAFEGKKSRAEYVEKPLLSDLDMTEEEKYERDLKKALAMENAWMESTKLHLPESL